MRRYYMQGFTRIGDHTFEDADGNTYDLVQWYGGGEYREAWARTPDGMGETYLITRADGRGLCDRDNHGNVMLIPGAEHRRVPRTEHGVLGALRASLDNAPSQGDGE